MWDDRVMHTRLGKQMKKQDDSGALHILKALCLHRTPQKKICT
jgi:hypothetical protein